MKQQSLKCFNKLKIQGKVFVPHSRRLLLKGGKVSLNQVRLFIHLLAEPEL